MIFRSSQKFFGLFVFLFLLWSIQLPLSFYQNNTLPFFTSALADEEEDEDEDEDEDEEEDEDEDERPKSSTKTINVIQEVIEYKPVTETVIVLDEAYQKDTDGDRLVDAVDPNPLIQQSEYFTDTDADGVPNALDQHHDEDDFAYYEFETDANNNGIIDSYEGE